jgi:hypothetical protein
MKLSTIKMKNNRIFKREINRRQIILKIILLLHSKRAMTQYIV